MSIEDALAKLRRKVEELGERRHPDAPPMRGLADGRRLGAAQDGDAPVFDKPSGQWVPGRQRAVGSHLHTAGYDVSVDDGGVVFASGMTAEHDTGDLVVAGDRITVPEDFEGWFHVELHVQSHIANGTWPAPEAWAAIMFHKDAGGATLGQYPAGTATSYTSVQNVGSDVHAHGGDYFQALIDWYSGVGGQPARSFQISCLSAFWWGP